MKKLKEMTLDEFKAYVKKNNKNQSNAEGLGEFFSDAKDDFVIVCKRCGSMDVIIQGENGCDYGEYTGYSEGTNVVKCKSCGNAFTWNK